MVPGSIVFRDTPATSCARQGAVLPHVLVSLFIGGSILGIMVTVFALGRHQLSELDRGASTMSVQSPQFAGTPPAMAPGSSVTISEPNVQTQTPAANAEPLDGPSLPVAPPQPARLPSVDMTVELVQSNGPFTQGETALGVVQLDMRHSAAQLHASVAAGPSNDHAFFSARSAAARRAAANPSIALAAAPPGATPLFAREQRDASRLRR